MQGHATIESLKNRDFSLLIDKSGSMQTKDTTCGSRWNAAKEFTQSVAAKMQELNPEGFRLTLFNSSHKTYSKATPTTVDQAWAENEPIGGTDLAAALESELHDYFQDREQGKAKPNGKIITVVTDGRPDNEEAVARVIKNATLKVHNEEEVGILFLQIGNDQHAADFLERLDSGLEKEGAKYDIVNFKTTEQMSNTTLSEAFLDALND